MAPCGRCANGRVHCDIVSYHDELAVAHTDKPIFRGCPDFAGRVGVRSAGWRERARGAPPPPAAKAAATAASKVAPAVPTATRSSKRPSKPKQQRPEPPLADLAPACAAKATHAAKATAGKQRNEVPRSLTPPKSPPSAPVERMWWGDTPTLEAKVPVLLQSGRAAEARALLLASAEQGSPITQFYMGVCAGQLEGEREACGWYERCLRQLPMMHAARNNLIRGLLQRGTAEAMAAAVEHAQLAAGLQPSVAEMQYQLGVVHMRAANLAEAADAYEATLCLCPTHRGALINGVHVLGQMAQRNARARLLRLAQVGVSAGLWRHPLQRPPHMVGGLESKPWHDRTAFGFTKLLEAHHAEIRREFIAASAARALGAVGGRAAHDSTLVAAGEWRELPLYGSQRRDEEACAACPVTARVMEQIPEAVELAMAGGGETIFSVLRPGTHLRAHCGSTNTRLTCHLGVVVPGGSRVRCGEEWREWKEGECIVFDDSWEHEVVHEGSADRVVLLINFWHPELPHSARRIQMDNGGYEPI